jgi:hypothetical protein
MQSEIRQYPARAAGLDLFPVVIIACGVPSEPAPRLLALQSAIAKAARRWPTSASQAFTCRVRSGRACART